MNKKERIKKLTWKYFFHQKLIELFLFIIISSSIIFIPYFVGRVGMIKSGEDPIWFLAWLIGLLIIFAVAGILAVIFSLLYCWLSDNWKKAKRRAKKEMDRS